MTRLMLYSRTMPRLTDYSQHFLRGPKLVAELIGHSNIRKNDTVYDLGAGSGVIASVLANKCKKVIAVESEPEALKKLRTNLGNILNVEIVAQDIVKLRIPEGRYKIFSNIPFSESAAIVRKFSESANPPIAMYLIVQKQFARKLVPSDQHFTAQLGAQLGPAFATRIRRPLRKTDFTPPPNVDTVLLEIKVREEPLLPSASMPAYREFVAKCYAEQKFFAASARAKANISPEKIPSQLSIDEWVRLYQMQNIA
jgi:16S rRNA A1518/A1519 N6-dimethyltransferase RsmA/KsgA/DIM1 with predicted DNA glycosylase/AP lyase activity